MTKNTKTDNPKESPKTDTPSNELVIVQLVKDAYGQYKIGGQLNSWIEVKKSLAEKMIESGHAVLVS